MDEQNYDKLVCDPIPCEICNTKDEIDIVDNVLKNIISYGNNKNLTVSGLKDDPVLEKYKQIIEKCCVLTNVGKQSKKKRKLDKLKNKNDAECKEEFFARKYKVCYICRNKFSLEDCETIVSEKYKCDYCKNLNQHKRNIAADLNGKVAIVTGARVKIGFETAIRLLECGCNVICTSRFLGDMINRYKTHPKYDTFKHLLTLYAIDLRYQKDIDIFYEYVKSRFTKVDILIHNAAQTIRRPKEFYQHLIQNEISQFKLITSSNEDPNISTNIINHDVCSDLVLPNDINTHITKIFGPLNNEDTKYFPKDKYDQNNEQIDLRENKYMDKKIR